MLDDTQFVVVFPNGKYYGGQILESETDDLKYANKYSFNWQIAKDLYLQLYCSSNNLTYDLVKVRQYYEIVE